MRENPVQSWTDLRQEVMDRLRGENEALLKRLAELEASGSVGQSQSSGEQLVPRESWEKEHKEKCDLEEMVKQKEKRLMRLQQVNFFSFFFPYDETKSLYLRRCRFSAARGTNSGKPCRQYSGSRSISFQTDRSR